jgi:hypothetical protein
MRNSMRRLGLATVGIALLAQPLMGLAAPVTLDFEAATTPIVAAGTGDFANRNFTSNGFRISPSCHVHVSTRQGALPSVALASDMSGCRVPGPFWNGNPDYLGSDPLVPDVYVDFFGAAFSFTSVDFATAIAGFSGQVFSSNGGVGLLQALGTQISGMPVFETINFSGPEWTDIRWLQFRIGTDDLVAVWIDNLVMDVPNPQAVPEPNTLALGVLCLALLLGLSRRR